MSAYLLRRVRVACDQRQACSDQWEGGDQTGKLPSILSFGLLTNSIDDVLLLLTTIVSLMAGRP
jgi:hypothetical protein